MPKAVESYVFSDSGFGNPLFQGMMSHGASQAFEDFSGTPFATQLQCLLTDGKGGLGFCLFGANTDVVALIRTDFKITPVQLQNITDTETGHAGKQGGLFQDWNLAWRSCQFLDFIKCQILFLDLFPFYFFQKVVQVLAQHLLFIGYFQ